MKYDAFSRCHPAVNFIFFLGAIGCSVVLQHPVYLFTGLIAAVVYQWLLSGRKVFRLLLGILPLFLLITAINPLFNTAGEHVLFRLFSRPYTLEALCCGAATGATVVSAFVWFACYSKVLSGDKFTSLFGRYKLSLLLVMILRMIPRLSRKAQQTAVARRCIGKGMNENSTLRDKLKGGMCVLSAVTDDALEGSIVTADSMRSRGYGSTKRSSFQIYRMQPGDYVLLLLMAVLLLGVIFYGHTDVSYTPRLMVQNISWDFALYSLFVFLPVILHTKEAIEWRISSSAI